jgi:hypothetical protein
VLQEVQDASLVNVLTSVSFRITAQDNSCMTSTITSTGVALSIDMYADGIDDRMTSTTWDFPD